jgi:hypothetical protein
MTSIALNIDPWVAGLAILVVIVTEIACRLAEAGALVDAAISDTHDNFWDDWTVENQRKLDRLNGQKDA